MTGFEVGNASDEEYLVALWLEQNNVQYIYQALYQGYRTAVRADFLILHVGVSLIFEVQGDHFHEGIIEVEYDRQRRLRLEEQGATVIELWGHDIVKYDGYPMPTDESFDAMMKAAMVGIQVSHRYG